MVRFYRRPLRRPLFQVEKLDPKVEIVMMYSESDGRFIKTCIDTAVSGIVIQGVNTGNVNGAMHNAILEALRSGIAIVLATNLPRGQVYPIYGFPGGGKALLLMNFLLLQHHRLLLLCRL
jgi:L-asparaginase